MGQRMAILRDWPSKCDGTSMQGHVSVKSIESRAEDNAETVVECRQQSGTTIRNEEIQ